MLLLKDRSMLKRNDVRQAVRFATISLDANTGPLGGGSPTSINY